MSKSLTGRIAATVFLAILLTIAGLVAWGFHLNQDLKRWDARIDALCAANGGKDVEARIYETAMAPLTKEYFATLDPPTMFYIPVRSVGQKLDSNYPYVIETRVVETLNHRDPSVVKYTERIVRVSDNKILAERFAYQRAGGGIPGFDPDEIRVCPIITTEKRLDVQVFENHPYHVPRRLQ